MKLIGSGKWKEGLLESGKLPNPRKKFFSKLAGRVVRDVNQMRDCNGLSYARKAMIRCGLAKDLNGQWCTSQLFLHLQNIITKYQEKFDGTSPFDTGVG